MVVFDYNIRCIVSCLVLTDDLGSIPNKQFLSYIISKSIRGGIEEATSNTDVLMLLATISLLNVVL